MEDFFLVFEQMKRQGPGSSATTRKVFESIPDNQKVRSILDVGCGKGQSSIVLSQISQARITAIDNHQPFLDHLEDRALEQGCSNRIRVRNISMFDIPFARPSFDLIWSEGSAYFMGFKKALSDWKSLIKTGGYLFISEAVWLSDRPSPACAGYFQEEYPEMSDAVTRKQDARELGYRILSDFILPRQDWLDFYDDMEACIHRAVKQKGMTPAFERMIREIKICKDYRDEFGYLCLLLSPIPRN